MRPIARREFIQIAGAGLGVAALGSGLVTNWWGLDANRVHDPQTDGDRVVPTFCELCFWKCGVLAHVKDGRVTKIVGNPAHPLSKGRLCPRGTGGTGLLYDPDRLSRPLVRRHKKSGQAFEAVDWDAALDEVARGLGSVKPHEVALFSHGYGGSWFKQLVHAMGSENIGAPSKAQCRGARDVGWNLTFGSTVGSPEVTDMPNARVITLIGSHLGENMHNTQVQDFAQALERGAELVVVDPRFSTAAGKARYWLPIKPGTDIALLLAWIHVIIEEKLYDADFIGRFATGFEALKKHVADKTPEWAFVRTTIDADRIRETARFIAGASPASMIHPGRHTAWYGDDTQRTRAIAVLNALCGSYGRRGGFYIPGTFPLEPYQDKWDFPHGPPPADGSDRFPLAPVLAHGLRDQSIGEDAAIKAWIVYGCNLIQSLPHPERTLRALGNLDFMVAVDVLPMEICGHADVVLPEATYLERYDDLAAPPFREPYVALRQPVVEPLGEAKPGWWIAKELGQRMGHERFFPWNNVEEYLQKRCQRSGIELDALKESGVLLGQRQPIYLEDGADVFDEGPGPRKVRLVAETLEPFDTPDYKLSLPDYQAPEEPDGAAGEFRLLFGRSPVHTFGRTTNNRFLSQIDSFNVLWLNARVADEMEPPMSCGTWVQLVNETGFQKCNGCGHVHEEKTAPEACPACKQAGVAAFEPHVLRSQPIRIKRTQRIRPDCVYMVHGFGHTARDLKFAKGRGANDTALIGKVKVDPVMGGTGMNVNFVRIERTQAPASADGGVA